MATDIQGQDISFKAAADLSAKQFYIVELSAANTVNVCDAATDVPLGVLQNKPAAANRAARVRISGVTKVVASAAISAGALVGTTATGTAVTKSADADHVLGIALEAASAASEQISVLIRPLQRAS